VPVLPTHYGHECFDIFDILYISKLYKYQFICQLIAIIEGDLLGICWGFVGDFFIVYAKVSIISKLIFIYRILNYKNVLVSWRNLALLFIR
jgi:hypothetical protein